MGGRCLTAKDKKVYNTVLETQPYCLLCGSQNESQLVMHHVVHGSMGRHTIWNDQINIARVCTVCHIKIHKNDKKYRPILLRKLNEIYGKNTKI